MLDHPDREPEEIVQRRHPLGVAARQVIVDGDDVDPAPEKSVRVDGQRRDERFAFARFHLGDLALVQHVAAHDLYVEMAHVEDALTGFAADRKDFGQHVVKRLACRQAFAEGRRLGRQLGIAEGRNLRLERIGRRHSPPQARDLAFVAVKNRLQKGHLT